MPAAPHRSMLRAHRTMLALCDLVDHDHRSADLAHRLFEFAYALGT
jgi:hypothetical protein